MLDLLNKPNAETELPLDTVSKRALIENELKHDANRSDREIARVVGCDHKTVASARAKTLPTVSPPVSPWKPDPKPIEPEFDPFDKDGEDMIVKHQPAIAIYLNPWNAVVIRQRDDGPSGSGWGDPCVFVNREHIGAVISRLADLLSQLNEMERADD